MGTHYYADNALVVTESHLNTVVGVDLFESDYHA